MATQEVQIAEMTPKASYYDLILQSKEAIPISVIAKDYGYSAKAMNELLHELRIQYRLPSGTWLVYRRHAKKGYTDKAGNELFFAAENLLSAGILNAKVNGQKVEGVIYFKENSPLFDIANAKSQVIRYPHALLNVPNQNNTPLVITLKKYVMRRICEIKLHSQLKPTITFDDVFSKCKVNANDKKKKFDARNVIIKFFEHLKSQNFISDFEVKKEGREFSKISFSFVP